MAFELAVIEAAQFTFPVSVQKQDGVFKLPPCNTHGIGKRSYRAALRRVASLVIGRTAMSTHSLVQVRGRYVLRRIDARRFRGEFTGVAIEGASVIIAPPV